MLKRLKEECYIVMGQSPSSEFYNKDKEGIPFLQGRKTFGYKYPEIDTWTTRPSKIGSKNSVLMSVRAPVGDVNIAPFDICIGRGLASIKMKNSNNQYLYYLLKDNIDKIKKKSSGTVFDAINRSDLENLILNFNDENEQLKIERVLLSIDNKIELNNQINNNLSEISKQLYKRWFIDYEFPNENGKPYKSSCGKMVESELGEIPENWHIELVKDVVKFSQGVQVAIENQVETKKDGYTRFIRIVDLTQNNNKDIRYIEDTARGKVEEKDIFMIRYGSPGILGRNYKGIIANNLFKIDPIEDIINKNYLYNYFNSDILQSYIKQNATSSTMPAINFSILNDRNICIPSKEILDKYSKIEETIRIKELQILNENKNLEQLRDTLLPKLMNSEIGLGNIEI